jgi:hypothetical protein
MQLKGGQQVTLTPGQTFYEGPDDVHVVDRNASDTKPAKFLVFMIKGKGSNTRASRVTVGRDASETQPADTCRSNKAGAHHVTGRNKTPYNSSARDKRELGRHLTPR